ncbi:MAG: hypothetical protein J1F29_02055 [Lentimicrobiaceae bacterium]|nr:hypothetical protein [Lentimicrobiaceae bacterium]
MKTISDSFNDNYVDENTRLIPNIYEIIDTHLSLRKRNPKSSYVYTIFYIEDSSVDGCHIQLLSNSQADFMIDMLFEQGDLKSQLELERFKKSQYYSFFHGDGGGGYTLILNAGQKDTARVLVDLMINVFNHPKGEFLKSLTEDSI